MTPARMRQIAERLETLCAELRMHIEESDGLRKACDGCKADARKLREFAAKMEIAEAELDSALDALGTPWNPSAKPN
jgi:hypothetical protein